MSVSTVLTVDNGIVFELAMDKVQLIVGDEQSHIGLRMIERVSTIAANVGDSTRMKTKASRKKMASTPSVFEGTALYSDSECATVASVVKLFAAASGFNASACPAAEDGACVGSAWYGGFYEKNFCAASTAEAGAGVFGGASYLQVAQWAACPNSSLVAAPTLLPDTDAALSSVALYALNACVSMPAVAGSGFAVAARNASSGAFFLAAYKDSACQLFASAQLLAPPAASCAALFAAAPSTALVVNVQSAIISVRYSGPDCSSPLSLTFQQAVLPCQSSDQCSFSNLSEGYIENTCPASFDMNTLTHYLSTGTGLFAPATAPQTIGSSSTTNSQQTSNRLSYAIVSSFFDNICSTPSSITVTFLNLCVTQRITDSDGTTVLSKSLSLDPTNGTLIRSRFSDSQCLVLHSTFSYGLPNGSCQSSIQTTIIQPTSNVTEAENTGLNSLAKGLISAGTVLGLFLCAVGVLVVVIFKNKKRRLELEKEEMEERRRRMNFQEFDIDSILGGDRRTLFGGNNKNGGDGVGSVSNISVGVNGTGVGAANAAVTKAASPVTVPAAIVNDVAATRRNMSAGNPYSLPSDDGS
ncbi:hypothetical protein HK100_005216 [Physocladia obscura]|uniref:Transmembrane protein n=1 Tax=Physocladia obscura TaxID=109957 RepID=A0AAD5SST0_9FUNG|nr:hypothetical protein HK100_005216 [Physocladia obscura]